MFILIPWTMIQERKTFSHIQGLNMIMQPDFPYLSGSECEEAPIKTNFNN